jgi:CubicO group peptidase (beta-lactamase class C family)
MWVFLFPPRFALAGDSPTTAPQSLQQSLHEVLEEVRQQRGVPALAAAIIRGDKIVAADAVGIRKVGSKVPVSLDDQFHLGSCAKSMTASLCAILVERGDLRWDTTIGEVFKDLPGIRDEFRKVTLEQLLCHRAGLPDDRKPDLALFLKMRTMDGPMRDQRRRMVELVLAQPPASEPGTTFAYSNYGFAIAGAMCEAVAGRQYEDLIHDLLFVPLEMKTGGFGPPGEARKVDQPYGHHRSVGLLGGLVQVRGATRMSAVERGPLADNPACMSPAGRIHCSISDFARYAAWHLAGDLGHARILKPETFKKLHTDIYQQMYAFGWGIKPQEWAGGRTLSHSGSNTMWFATIVIAPEQNEAFVVATNAGGDEAEAACNKVVELLRSLESLR